MNQSSKLFVAVKAFIVNDKQEVLLIREASLYKDGTNIGKYDVPGGRISEDESLHEGLVREVQEETGLTILEGELFDVSDSFNKKGDEIWHIVRIFYKVKCQQGEVALSGDHDEYIWSNVEDAVKKDDVIENLIPLLKRLR